MSTDVSSGPDLVQSMTVPVPGPEATVALERLRSAIAAYSAARFGEAAAILTDARQKAAAAVSMLSRREARAPAVSDTLAAIRALQAAGVYETPSSTENAELATALAPQGWPGLLAAMLLAPSWQCASAPLLEKVPDWLWGDYAAWLFAAAHRPDSAPFVLPHLEELYRWSSRNAGSSAVRAASDAWLHSGACIPAGGTAREQRRGAELRGLLLTRLLARKDALLETPPLSRFGRALRIGLIAESFDDSATTYRLLALFEHLPAAAFEISLLAFQEVGTSAERACRAHAVRFTVLPADLTGRIDAVRQADLDVLVFGGELSTRPDDLTRLALHRLAPLQIADQSASSSTGLPEIDVSLSCNATPRSIDPAVFTERVGLLNGSSRAYALPAASSEASLTRETLDLPADAPLFSTVVTHAAISAATLDGWARVLSAAPDARLVIALTTDSGDNLCQDIETAFAEHAIPTSRVSIFPADTGAPDDIRALLRLTDLYLDSSDIADPRWTLEALKLARPALAIADASAAAPLLQSMGLDELLANSAEARVQLAANLANDSTLRSALTERLAGAIETGTAACFDTLAASDAFGALVETAFDELGDAGRAHFRSRSEPLRFASNRTPAEATAALERHDLSAADELSLAALRVDPTSTDARVARGQVLLAKGEASAAVAYLLAAAQQTATNAGLWFSLAKALRADGKTHDSLMALETSLRLDGTRPEAWHMLAELADAVGIYDLAEQAREIVRSLDTPKPAAAGAIKLNLSGKLRGLRPTAS